MPDELKIIITIITMCTINVKLNNNDTHSGVKSFRKMCIVPIH